MDRDLQDQGQGIDILSLLHLFVKRKKLIAKICGTTVIVSVIYSLTLPNIYVTTAKVLPPQKEGAGGISALLGQSGGLAGVLGGLGGGADLYLGLLKSRSVLDPVIAKFDLIKYYDHKNIDQTRQYLEVNVKTYAGKDGIISITTEDKDPQMAARLANAIVQELGRTTVRLNLTKAGSERAFLEKRLEVVKADLKTAEENLKSFAQSNKVVQVDSQAKASIEGIARMKAEVASKEVQLSVLMTKQTEESAEVKAAKAGIQRLRNEIGQLAGNNAGSEGVPSIGSVPGVGLEYARRMRELKTQEAIFEQLTKQYEVAKLNEARDSSAVQIVDEAFVPKRKSKPSRSLIVLLSGFTSFLFSLFLISWLEYLERISAADREKLFQLKKQTFSLK